MFVHRKGNSPVLITKFNKMIRNKWLWTGFALLISVSFLGYFSPRSSGCGRNAFREDMKAGNQGKLFDRSVSRTEFMTARFFEMGLRESMALTPEARERLHRRTWQRLAALRAAEQMGVRVSPDEIRETIARDPNFAVNGAFSRERYRATVEAQLRISLTTFESYLLQELTLRKLADMLESLLLTSPMDLQRRLSNLTDTFTVQYAALTRDTVRTEVATTPADAERFYDEHQKMFTEPAKVSVTYVSFPITNYLAGITVTESDMKDYYEEYDEEFRSGDTNAPADRLPFEQVTNTIAARLRDHEAEKGARNAATEFVMKLADRSENAPGFAAVAASQGLTLSTSGFFTVAGRVPGLQVASDFNKAAFDLDSADRTRSFSDAVTGSNAVYVLSAHEKVEEHIPAFAEVKERATKLARQQAEDAAFIKRCRDLRRSLKKDLESGKTFALAASGAGLTIKTTEPFSVYEGLTNDASYSEELASSVMYMNKGELSDLVPITNGVILAFIVDRQAGDPAATVLLKPQMQSLVDRYNVAVLLRDWEDYLLSKPGFEDYAPVKLEDERASARDEDGEPHNPIEP